MEKESQETLHIIIPDALEPILKKYTKGILRAQPDDLLQWSANYFRSLMTKEAGALQLENEDNMDNM